MKIKKEYFQYFIEAGQKQVYQPSDIIYMQEDDADLIYLILNGKVKVYVMNSNGKEVTMDILQSGDIFGESAFISQSKRPTTIQAISDVEVIACYPKHLYPYLLNNHKIYSSIFYNLYLRHVII